LENIIERESKKHKEKSKLPENGEIIKFPAIHHHDTCTHKDL